MAHDSARITTNTARLRVLLTLGTRPEAIKMAPVILECRKRSEAIEPIVCFTGQHREMLRQVTDYFGIEADVDLDLMTPGQTPATFAARCLTGLDEVLGRYQPDCVVAQGDTTSVMAAGLAAFYRRVNFVHVEAGLRTGNLQAPWPEELNRRIASLVTTLHCAPTRRAADNLLAEGVSAKAIHVTGNTVIDALLATVERERGNADHWQAAYPMLAGRRLVLITGHRRENFGDGLRRICEAIAQMALELRDVAFVYPVHMNPHVCGPVHAALSGFSNVYLVPPAPYPGFVWLMDRSTLILTDSGGVQEEAPSLGKPVLVMRDTTERPEAVEAGAAQLVGTSVEAIVAAVVKLLSDPAEYARRQAVVNPFGDGLAAARIIDLLIRLPNFARDHAARD
ncbi:MAG TPA: UDP-N-acetylglucosamine 2-epimerase (non-hydrolyzing) [Pirellulales bacterium]|nr:UDP-N-acetylglucosamine 2-epimerase (non-hydrolyzing) [Pirellulales bacterium]